MKKTLQIKIILLLLTISSGKGFSQTGTPQGTIGDYFVESVSPVINTITIPDPDPNTFYIKFMATDPSGNTVYDSFIDSTGAGWDIDMGSLPADAIIWAEYYDEFWNYLDYSNNYPMTIIPKPYWLTQGSVSNVSVSGNSITMDAIYPISAVFNDVIPANIKGINGKPFEVLNNEIRFSVDFDMQTSNSTVTNAEASFSLNTLGQSFASYQIPLSSGFSLDNDFNLTVLIADSISTPKYECNFPAMRFPIAPAINVKVDAGISFYATLKGQIVVGQSGSQWGFIDNGGQKTKIIAKAEGTGFIRSGISVLAGLGSANGSLEVTGRIGGGFDYVSIPSSQINPLFGGDFDISGKIEIKTFWGFGPKATYGPTSFYNGGFGDYSALGKNQVGNSFDEIFGAKSISYKTNATLILPDNAPQPSFATRGKNLYAVWVENIDNTGFLLFSKLDTNGVYFDDEYIVQTNDNSISNPQVAIMPSGSALITWTQCRYSPSTLPGSATTENLMYSQDIWGAIYDSGVDSITYIFQMSDDNSGLETGRAEGEARISMGKGTNGIITWVSRDPSTETSDIWYSQITESSGWNLSAPQKLADLPGINKNVVVTFVDSVNALAVWINDPDAADTTLDDIIYFSEWDGNNWTNPSVLVSNNGNESFDELSVDYNNNYCLLAWTSKVFDPNGEFENKIDIAIWDNNAQQWTGFFYDSDSSYYFQKPRVSVSDQGLASVAYQVIEMFADTNNIDPGEIYLYLKDLTTNNNWVEVSNNPYISDPTTFAWEMDAGFGGNNRFYVLTQEYNESTGIVTNPSNGVLFGDPNLSMVLRGVQVNNDLTITDISEPSTPTGLAKNYVKNPETSLLNNFPNPFNSYTVIEYRIMNNAKVSLDIFDLMGRKITTLINQQLAPGVYQTVFEPGNIPPGIYLYQLTVNGRPMGTKKMVITK